MLRLLFALVLVAAACHASAVLAESPPLQSFSGWKKGDNGSFYCRYHFKKTSDETFDHQTWYWFPANPKWLFLHKPAADFYWCRCPCPQHHPEWNFDEEQWSFRNEDGSYTELTDDCPVLTPNGPKKPGSGRGLPPVPEPDLPPVPCD
jgi:hypothetical protein